MNKSLLIGLFLVLLLVVSVSALVVNTPIVGQNVSEFTNVSFSNSSVGVTLYNLSLYNSTGAYVLNMFNYYTSIISNSHVNVPNYCPNNGYSTISSTINELGSYIAYSESGSYNNGYITINYANGSVQTYSGGSTNLNLNYTTISVSSISISTCSNANGYFTSQSFIFYPSTNNNSYSFDNYLSNVPVGSYFVNVSAFNGSSLVDSNVSGIFNVNYNSLLNITALNYTGGVVQSFNVSLYDYNSSSYSYYSTSSGLVKANTVIGHYYIAFISGNFASASANITISSVFQAYNFNTLPYNSVNVSIFDEVSKGLISQPINIYVQSSGFYQNYSTSSGNYVISNLSVGNYTVTLSGANYTSRSYVLSVNPASSQLLSAYLLQNSSSSSIDIYVKGVNYQVLPGALMTVQRQYYGGSYATVAQGVTDANGFLQLNLQQGVLYNVILSASSYSLKSFTYTFYATNSPYTFVMSSTTSGVYTGLVNGVNYFYSPTNSTLDENTSYTFQITAFNANSSVMWVAVNVNGVVVNVTGSAGGATASEVYNTGNLSVFPVMYSFYYYNSNDLQYEVFSIPVSYSINQVSASNSTFIQAAQSFQSQTSQGWLAIVGVFGILAAVATIVQLSGNTLAGAVVGMAIMVVEAFLGWISAPIVIAIVVLNGIMLYVGSR